MLLLIATGSVPEVWRTGRQPIWIEMRSPLARLEVERRFSLPRQATAHPARTSGFATEAVTTEPTLADWSRAAARLMTLMLAGLSLFLLVAEGPARLWHQPIVALGELAIAITILLGYALSWQREAAGALFTTAAIGGLLVLEGLLGSSISTALLATIAAPPLLFLVSTFLRRLEPFDIVP